MKKVKPNLNGKLTFHLSELSSGPEMNSFISRFLLAERSSIFYTLCDIQYFGGKGLRDTKITVKHGPPPLKLNCVSSQLSGTFVHPDAYIFLKNSMKKWKYIPSLPIIIDCGTSVASTPSKPANRLVVETVLLQGIICLSNYSLCIRI